MIGGMGPIETVADKVKDARLMARLSKTGLAALAGASRSTVSRAEDGKATPSAELYLRLLRAAGFYDDGTRLVALSRPSATWAARWLLDDLADEPDSADEWVAAWTRVGLVDADGTVPDPESLLFRAGRSAVLHARPGAVTAVGGTAILVTAATLDDAGVEYAVTGDAALERLGTPLIPVWPVLYVSDVRAALDALGLSPRIPGEKSRRRTTLIPFDGTSETGRLRTDDHIWWASPVQVALDGYGGYGRMIEQTQILVRSWEVDA